MNTKEKLKSVAEEQFFKYGYNQVSGRGLCEIAGISRSRLKYYFDDKESLASEIIRDSFKELHYKLIATKPFEEGDLLKSNLQYMSVLLMCITDILSKNESPSAFYNECMNAGVVAPVLTEYVNNSMSIINREMKEHYDRAHILTYAKIFVNAFSTNVKKYREVYADEGSSNFFGEIYSDLYMKLLDVPKEVRTEIVAYAKKQKQRITVKYNSMYDIEIKYF